MLDSKRGIDQQQQQQHHDRMNVGEEDELQLQGFTNSLWKTIIIGMAVFASGGLIAILMLLKPAIRIRLTKKRCSLDKAQILVLKDKYGDEFVEQMHVMPNLSYRYFMHKKIKYIWTDEYEHFKKLKGLDQEKCSVLYSQVEGASSTEAAKKLNLFGRNSIDIEVLPIWRLTFNEITGPFYLYQFFIICVWLIQDYYQFAACIFILSTVSVAMHVWQTRKQSIALRKKVHSTSMVTVIRDSISVQKNSTELIPGDVIVLPKHSSNIHYMMECDAVLMTGSCIMDESMLTGESLPVPKVPLVDNPTSIYSSSIHKSNTLFSGTKLLNVYSKENIDVMAVVVRTGFSTTKGELARSILYPMQMNNNIKRQMIKMSIIFVFLIGIPSFIYTYYALSRFDFATTSIMIIVLDVGTFLIPPVLPAVLTSVNVHAQRRLKKKGIFCLNSQAIACAGEIDTMCFDKTGTLTEDTIDFAGIVPILNRKFQSILIDMKCLPADSIIVKTMASCHSLVEYKGNIEGDDLDLKLFSASEWTFVQDMDDLNKTFGKIPERIVTNTFSGTNYQLIGIMKQYPFESFLQRMLVIIKDVKENRLMAIVKGAPEVLKLFCIPETLPENFNEILEQYTSQGFRVLATASKIMDTMDMDECLEMSRSLLESDMTFNGFYLFKNKLKPSSEDIIKELMDANIRCVMATGDNILTALAVAQECNMVNKCDAIIRVKAITNKLLPNQISIHYDYVKYPDFMIMNNNDDDVEANEINEQKFNYHIAIDGESYNIIRNSKPSLIDRIIHKGTIFARMTPDQKKSLITILRKQDHNVGMCGDGANDCGALRAADAGIALSVAEASVASPFTYKNKDISCVPSLIKEGRCTLVSVFGTFKYQSAYCFILLGAALILFWHGFRPSDGTYVFVDVIMNILPPMVFATTYPYPKLSQRMPIRNLLSFIQQMSLYSFIIGQVFIYYLIRTYLITQPFYVPVISEDIIEQPVHNQIAYAIFSANTMSYVIAAIVFAPGPPYRLGFFQTKSTFVWF
ncbi:cation-transporting atpase-like protein [Dermatophagoides farinae]|uniref:Cation-transporting ATPase n=1 Tax=Dermatophagoides farinae TaxID=6954 RepID=A0A9D4SDZ4_DERFA|nr:probable cation-transporting ATPase 13A5 [Dermatophagoides farinae]KAH7638542.1 cation-transporting atpase-like protein [Dermatophagoides farinae]